MPAPKIVFHPDAVSELHDAWSWYDSKSLHASEEFLTQIQHALHQIQKLPRTWPVYGAETRRFVLHRFPFAVVYLPTSSIVNVIAVSHSSRKPFYWLSRMDEE